MNRTPKHAACLFATVLLLMVGCSSGDEPDEGGDSGSSGSPEDITVAFIPHFRSPFTQIMVDGAEAAAAEFPGVELVVAGPTGFDAPAAIAALDDAVANGAQGAAVVPFPSEVWTRPLDDHVDDGIVTATFNVPALDSVSPLYVGVNEFDIGRATADIVLDELGDDPSGEVVLGNCAPGVQVVTDRIDGFNAQMEEQAPDLEVAEAVDVLAEPTANRGAWEALIAANPDAVAFAGFCAFDLPNLVSVKEQTSGDYVVAGGDLEPETLRGIREGLVSASVSQSPFMQGYVPVRAILENLINGTPMPEGWIDAGIEVVDADNIDDIEAREADPALMLEWYQPQIDEIFGDSAAAAAPLDDLRN